MELTKIIVTLAITFAMTIALMKSINIEEQKTPLNLVESSSSSTILPKEDHHHEVPQDEPNPILPVSKRVSRFLKQEEKNPRAADHCNKDEEVCYLEGGKSSICCNNKCIDVSEDKHNCGGCKNMCKYTQECCRGQCVDIAFDKRHCGECNHRCPTGEYCVYGMCNYA